MRVSSLVIAVAALGSADARIARKGNVRVDAAVGAEPVAFVAVMSPSWSGGTDTVYGQTPASLWPSPTVQQVEIRSRDPRRAVWVRVGGAAPSLFALTGAAGARVLLGAASGGLALVRAEPARAPKTDAAR